MWIVLLSTLPHLLTMSQQFCHRLLFQSQPNPSPKLKLTLTLTLNLAQNLASSCNPNLTITLLITDYNRLKWLKRQAFYKKLIWYHFRGLFAYGPIKFKHLTIQLLKTSGTLGKQTNQ